ncbi:MAG: FAD:protein FMN transferase [bacterium]|nr:FAD:protein FMN transferase [bacterium]
MTVDNGNRAFLTRRRALTIVALGGASAVAWRLGLFRGGSSPPATRTRTLMGTTVNLTVLGDDRDAAGAAADATLDAMAALEASLSRYRPDSEISVLNRTGRIDAASDAVVEVLRLAQEISGMGDGAFDVTIQPVLELYRAGGDDVPAGEEIERALESVDGRALRIEGNTVTLERSGMRVTPDGIGKGYIVDRGVDELKARGFGNVFVEAGGDLVAAGSREGGRPWRVGIRDPRLPRQLRARFHAVDRAVATSGDYMQPFTDDFAQHHILDPRTGRSAPELASATVVAADAATADGLATLAMVLGPRRGRELIEDLPGCEGYFVSKKLEATRTTGFDLV